LPAPPKVANFDANVAMLVPAAAATGKLVAAAVLTRPPSGS
jgi:hypothetical protein